MNRRPYLVVILLCVASLAAGAGGTAVFLATRKKPATEPRAPVEKAPVAVAAAPALAGAADPARLPADRVLLPAAAAAECRGKPVCGHCEWQVGTVCRKDVLWDAEKRHLVVLLPNEKLAELQEKLTPK
jgi:hypothetical protein